ncbi:Mpo1-like protein [Ferruginibacter yonginensis]|uniref:Mpo1-like protein n=1 Tax=Ferruginibacter yonginensis TaxID=1310416 RepID=A0ABV8QVP0_9BACT
MASNKAYKSFSQFYPYYLTEHANKKNRLLHFCGTTLLILILLISILLQKWWALLFIPLVGYGFAWIGHFFIEKNKPATFTYPLYSLAGDFVMFWHMLTGKIDEQLQNSNKLKEKRF